MPVRTSYAPGTPCWIDLVSPDPEASAAFYTSLFGWTAEPQTDGSGNRIYTMLRKDGQDAAGLSSQPPAMAGAPPAWNSYVAVADAEVTTAAAEKAGGKVLMPVMDVMDSGRMAVIADPTGAVFSIWQAGTHAGAGIINEPDTYAWNELLSSDLEAAKTFYSDVFGWEYNSMDMGPGGIYSIVKGGQDGLAGLMTRPPQLPAGAPDAWLVYFIVSDIEAKIAATTDAGGTVVYGPADLPQIGKIATLADPQRGIFCLMQPLSA